MKVRFKKILPGAKVPVYSSEFAAGADLCACVEESVTVKSGESVMLPTGIAVALPSSGYVALVFARSGLGVRHGIALSNGVGVIDSDYRGELRVPMVNLSNEPYTIQPGERVAQLCIAPVWQAAFAPADELTDTARGAGGFGSTGK